MTRGSYLGMPDNKIILIDFKWLWISLLSKYIYSYIKSLKTSMNGLTLIWDRFPFTPQENVIESEENQFRTYLVVICIKMVLIWI